MYILCIYMYMYILCIYMYMYILCIYMYTVIHCMCYRAQLSPVEASIVQPSPEQLRKRQLASQLFGMGGGGLSGPSRAPRHKRKGNQSKIDSNPPHGPGGQKEAPSSTVTTDLLLDLQVSPVHVHVWTS